MAPRPPQRPFTAERRLAEKSGTPLPLASNGTGPGAAPQAEVRGPNVDLTPILESIHRLESKLDRASGVDREQMGALQHEVVTISQRIKVTRSEIAALKHPLASQDKLQSASEHLEAVVQATERATNDIMSAAEAIDDAVQEVRAQLPEGYQADRLNDVSEQVVRIYEACNFQDLTGQRITKVVRTLSFIEERVARMVRVWGIEELAAEPLPPDIDLKDGDLALRGPSAKDKPDTVTQDDIDKMFG
jgi:chemotaxis protein CheZ